MFVPIGAEEEVSNLAVNAFDLVLPGSEDAGRIFKQVGVDSQHFATEQEALAVRHKLDDVEWTDTNCASCNPPAVLSSTARRKRRWLIGRGSGMSICCRVPAFNSPVIPDIAQLDQEEYYVLDNNANAQQPINIHDTQYVGGDIPEATVSTDVGYTTWDDAFRDRYRILADLEKLDTAVLTWSPEVAKVFSSQDIFSLLRRAFEIENPTPASADLTELLRVHDIQYKEIGHTSWISGVDLDLAPTVRGARMTEELAQTLANVKLFRDAALQQAKQVVQDLKGLSRAETQQLRGSVNFYYTSPEEGPFEWATDERGLVIETGVLQLVAADQPGLIVQNSKLNSLARTPKVDNAWQLLKSAGWKGIYNRAVKTTSYDAATATHHTVFGPKIAEQGRVSMVVSIMSDLPPE